MDRKRAIIAFIFLLVCIGVGYLLYRVFFAAETPDIALIDEEPSTADKFPQANQGAPLPTQEETGVPLPVSQGGSEDTTPDNDLPPGVISGEVEQVVNVAVTGVSTDTRSGNPRFYNDEDGKFYRLNANGKVEPISDQVFYNVKDVTWSPVSDVSIIEYPDGANIYYNFETKQQASLPKHWDSFSFAPTGEKIVAKSLAFSPENRWLVSSDPDGNNIELVEPLGNNADKVIVDWSPNKQVVALSTTGEDLGSDRQEVLFIGSNGENFKSTIVEGRGLTTNWSKNGERLLYSVHSSRSEFKPELWIVNAAGEAIGENRKPLLLNTWADKCTFTDDRFAYCGVPKELPKGAGFAPSLADTISDDLYKIDVETGQKTPLPMTSDHVISSIFVGKDGKIYFTDKNKSGLFTVSQ